MTMFCDKALYPPKVKRGQFYWRLWSMYVVCCSPVLEAWPHSHVQKQCCFCIPNLLPLRATCLWTSKKHCWNMMCEVLTFCVQLMTKVWVWLLIRTNYQHLDGNPLTPLMHRSQARFLVRFQYAQGLSYETWVGRHRRWPLYFKLQRGWRQRAIVVGNGNVFLA